MTTIANNIAFPEGPAFDKEGNTWLVEKEGGNLICIKAQHVHRYFTGGAPNGIAIGSDNRVWFCDSQQNKIRIFDLITGTIETVAEQTGTAPLKMPNDLAFDNKGNLLFTCPGDKLTDGTGYVCCLAPGQPVLKVWENLFYPNGLAFSEDFSRLYLAETGTRLIREFNWDARSLTLSAPVVIANAGGTVGPDGIALDEAENIYVAVYGAGVIKKFNRKGHLSGEISLPGKNPTNCAIDPQGQAGLLVTEAETGSLLQIETTAKGIIL